MESVLQSGGKREAVSEIQKMQGCVSASLLRGQRTLENDCMYIKKVMMFVKHFFFLFM